MFSFVSYIFGEVKKCYFWLKELSYSAINVFGYKVEPEHFTEKDREKYEKWITNHKALIEKIALNTDLLKYFELDDSLVNPEPKIKFKRPDGSSLDSFENTGKPFRPVAKKIFDKITAYLKPNTVVTSVIVKKFNAKENKMCPEKMVLSFLAKYVETQLIGFYDQSDQLVKIRYLLEYLSELTSDDLVKYDKDFHDLLCAIKKEVREASNTILANVEINNFKNSITRARSRVTNLIDDGLSYLRKLFNFTKTEPKDITGTTDTKGYDNWEKQIIRINSDTLNLDKIDSSHLDKIKECLFVNASYVESGMCPVFRGLLSDLNLEPSARLSITEFQNNLFNLVLLNKALRNLELLFEKNAIVNIEQVNKILKYLRAAVDKFQVNLQQMTKWRDEYDKYKDKVSIVGQKIDALSKLQFEPQKIAENLERLLLAIKDLSKLTSDHDKKVNIASQKEDEELRAYIDNILDLRLNIDQKLPQKNIAAVSEIVLSFLHDLRVNGKFHPDLRVILSGYFIIEEGANHEHQVKGVDSGKIKLADKPAYQYLNLLLTIFVRLLKADFTEQVAFKAKIVGRFKTFLINDFMLNDQQAIELLFDFLVGTVTQVKDLELQKKKLGECVRKYLESFERQITETVMKHGSAKSDIFTPASKLEAAIKLAQPVGCDELSANIYFEVKEKDSFVTKLEKFVHNILLRISREECYYKLLVAKLRETPLQEINPKLMDDLCASMKHSREINDETRNVLLGSAELINNLVIAYVVFKKDYLLSSELDKPSKAAEENVVREIETLEKLLADINAKKEAVIKIGCAINSTIASMASGFNEKEVLLFSRIKEYCTEYLLYINSLKPINFCLYNYLSWISGGSFLLECAAVKYINELLCQIEDEPSVDNRNKLYVTIKSLFANKEQFSKQFFAFIESIYNCVSRVVSVDGVRQLKLVVHKWGSGDLNKAVKELDVQVAEPVAAIGIAACA